MLSNVLIQINNEYYRTHLTEDHLKIGQRAESSALVWHVQTFLTILKYPL